MQLLFYIFLHAFRQDPPLFRGSLRQRVRNVSLKHIYRAASVLKVVHQFVNPLRVRPVLDFNPVHPMIINFVLLQL